MKLRITKALLWLLLGAGAVAGLLHLLRGSGTVTALTDISPWSLWKGLGGVAVVALGAAGLTLAMLVHVFRWQRCRPVVRGAVLLALLAYASVGIGAAAGIGLPWHIVLPVWHWHVHSTLFDVGPCCALYLGLLALELGRPFLVGLGNSPRSVAAMHGATVLTVVACVALSALLRSSLGTVPPASPSSLHAPWHTALLHSLFLMSSVAVGCLTISLATLVVHWLHDARAPMQAIAGLGRVAAWLLGAYLVLRLGEVAVSGEAGLLRQRGWDAIGLPADALLSAGLPLALLASRRLRESPRAMLWISLCAVVGYTLSRVDVAGLVALTASHRPPWTECAVTLGILAGAALVCLAAVERLEVFPGLRRREVTSHPVPVALEHHAG